MERLPLQSWRSDWRLSSVQTVPSSEGLARTVSKRAMRSVSRRWCAAPPQLCVDPCRILLGMISRLLQENARVSANPSGRMEVGKKCRYCLLQETHMVEHSQKCETSIVGSTAEALRHVMREWGSLSEMTCANMYTTSNSTAHGSCISRGKDKCECTKSAHIPPTATAKESDKEQVYNNSKKTTLS